MHDANASRASETFVPLTASAVLVNAVGLHARPSVKLTQCAKSFAAAIEIGKRPEMKGKLIVVIVASGAERYLSTDLFADI